MSLSALAACWKGTERAPARVARLLRALAGRPAWRVAVGAAVVGVGGIAVVAILVVGLRPGSSDTTAGPGIWVAVVRPEADTQPSRSLVSTIQAFDIVTGRERAVGEPAVYGVLAFSPGGDRLAAIDVDTSEESPAVNVRIWTFAGEPIARVSFAAATEIPTALAWSPDGTRLAAIGPGGVTVLDSSGRRLGRAHLTPLADSVSDVRRATDYWSPDSRYVAVFANGLVLVADREGAGREFDLPPTLRGRLESVPMNFYGWKDSGRVALVAAEPAGAEEYIGVVGGSSIRWGDPAPFDINSLFADPRAVIDQVGTLVPGAEFVGEQPTADRSADVFVFREPRDQTVRTILAVRFKNEMVIVDFGTSGSAITIRRVPFDVVVVPGWSGKLPARFDAATPMAAATPRAQPSGFETPSGSPGSEPTLTFASPDPAVTPLPYPSPRGERITPQVAGLPSYPGAEEIDGFTKGINGAPAAVQMFATVDTDQQVIAFFDSHLTATGFGQTSHGANASGERWAYIRGPRPCDGQHRVHRPA